MAWCTKEHLLQTLKNNQWVNIATQEDENIKLENAILNKAKKLKLISG